MHLYQRNRKQIEHRADDEESGLDSSQVIEQPHPGSTLELSPFWSNTAKTIIGLSSIAVLMALFLLIRTQGLLAPLLLTFVLIYLLHPIARYLSRWTRLGWRLTVTILYLLLGALIVFLVIQVWGRLVQQVMDLMALAQNFLVNMSETMVDWPLSPRIEDALFSVTVDVGQYLLGQVAGLVGTLATTATLTVSWSILIFFLSYFVLLDLAPNPHRPLLGWRLPRYSVDIQRIVVRLDQIWRDFFRSQGILFLITLTVYFFVLTGFQVQNALIITVVAGFSRFVPYLGAVVTWTLIVIVTLLQGNNQLGLSPQFYTLLVLTVAVSFDQMVEYLIAPKLYGRALSVHPAAILIAAFVGYGLIGLVGMILAAPLLATLLSLSRYIMYKMLDVDPWVLPEPAPIPVTREEEEQPNPPPVVEAEQPAK
jgi:predicted PurR-regulated permease PerM